MTQRGRGLDVATSMVDRARGDVTRTVEAVVEPSVGWPSADYTGSQAGRLNPFTRVDLAALLSEDRPPRPWVLEGLIPAGASVALVAPAGAGKSLLCLALALDIARGRPTFAGRVLPESRRVLLVDMENTEDDLAERLKALGVTADDCRRGDLDNLVLIHIPPLAALDTQRGAWQLEGILDGYGVTEKDVVVLDSFQRVVQGPENDADTVRAYYRHTGSVLKRRGVTVVRTDNTGKDTDRGARGSSGKRDDVDVELHLDPDPKHPGRMTIRPGKVRLTGINPVSIVRSVDEAGRILFTAHDPRRAKIDEAKDALDRFGVPLDTSERKAAELLKARGVEAPREAIRQAVRERKQAVQDGYGTAVTAPNDDGAPARDLGPNDCADDPARTRGATRAEAHETEESQAEPRADNWRRTHGAAASGAPVGGAPPLALSMESGAPARTAPPEAEATTGDPTICPHCGGPKSLSTACCVPCALARSRRTSAGDHQIADGEFGLPGYSRPDVDRP